MTLDQELASELVAASAILTKLQHADTMIQTISSSWQWPEVGAMVTRQEVLVGAIRRGIEAMAGNEAWKTEMVAELKRLVVGRKGS